MSNIGGNSEDFLVCHEALNTKFEEDMIDIQKKYRASVTKQYLTCEILRSL